MIWKILCLSRQHALEIGPRVWLDNHLPDSWVQPTIAEEHIYMVTQDSLLLRYSAKRGLVRKTQYVFALAIQMAFSQFL